MSMRPNMQLETCRACAGALKTFTTDRDIARRVVDGGGIRALINLIMEVGDTVTKQDCTRSLCSLFHYEDIVPKLIDQVRGCRSYSSTICNSKGANHACSIMHDARWPR
jgi:hypothetical protein